MTDSRIYQSEREKKRRKWKNGLMLFLAMTLCSHGAMALDEEDASLFLQNVLTADVTGYETVTISVDADSYDSSAGKPYMPKVKYNKQFPLVITSDDMGKGELINNWATMNGYPVVSNEHGTPSGDEYLSVPYNTAYNQESSDADDYTPLTYSDDTGKQRRFTATSAIWAYNADNTNYTLMNAKDAKVMARTGWSFAFHDVDNCDVDDASSIKARFQPLSEEWAEKTNGVGLKVMVEPGGNHNYSQAAEESEEIAMNILQNYTAEHPKMSDHIDDWTTGTDITTFSDKSKGSAVRTFYSEDNDRNFKEQVQTAITGNDNTKIFFYGSHGLSDAIKNMLKQTVFPSDKVWVAGADELWEYYHIYNNVIIGDPTYSDGKLTFDVQVPTYKKNQFRELTINIPGISNGTNCTTTGATVVTGGARQGTNRFTVNIGLENKILTYIDELTRIYRTTPTNRFAKRDAQYLIDLLWDSDTKAAKQAALDAEFNYTYEVNAVLYSDAGKTTQIATQKLTSGENETESTIEYYYPRYILHENVLYEAAAQSSLYAGTLNVTGENVTAQVDYVATDKGNVVFYAEGEDLNYFPIGATSEGNKAYSVDRSQSYISGVPSKLSANDAARFPDNINSAIKITTLDRGAYKIVCGLYAVTNYNSSLPFSFYINDVNKNSLSSLSANTLTEYDFGGEFEITENGSILKVGSPRGNKHLVDYAYIIKTGDLSADAPTVVLSSDVDGDELLKNTEATLTVTATLNGGSAITNIQIQQIGGTEESPTYTTVATATNAETATYTFTPTEAGILKFRAKAVTDGNDDLTGYSEVMSVNVVDYLTVQTYTLNLIDKSGNTVFQQTVSRDNWSSDPLADIYKSPFAKNYKYYTTSAEAAGNSGSALTDDIDSWTQADVYVGYDVDETLFSSAKAYAIYANNMYMHPVHQPKYVNNPQTRDHNVYNLQNQKWDVANYGNNTAYGQNEVSVATLPFVDNTYMWSLGSDPYNITFLNKATPLYIKTNYNANPALNTAGECASDASKKSSFALVYWRNKNGSSVDKSVPYFRLYVRGGNAASNAGDDTDTGNHYLACYSNNNDYQWREIDGKHSNFDTFAKVYVSALPEVTMNILNEEKKVECSLQGYFMEDATMPSFCPYYLYRAYTSGQTFYYDQDATQQIATGQTVKSQTVLENGCIYMTYTLSDDWKTVDKTRNTLEVKSFQDSDEKIQWYFIRAANNDEDFISANTTGVIDVLPSTMKDRKKFSAINSEVDGATSRLAQWAFIGTPYNMKLMNRYFGTDGYVGISENAAANDEFKVFAADADGVITEWEVMSGLSESNKLFIRPAGAANGEAPLLYMGWNGGANLMSLTETSGGNQALDFTWAAETVNRSIEFQLYDRDGNSLQLTHLVTGVQQGTQLEQLFSTTNLNRKFCDYTFYLDAAFENQVETVGSATNATIYVKWEYNDNAPVFSAGTNPDEYQFYTIKRNVGNYNYYYAYDPENQTLSYNSANLSVNAPYYESQWAFVGDPYAFKLYNRAAGKCLDAENMSDFVEAGNAGCFDLPEDDKTPNALYIRVKGSTNNLTETGQIAHIVVPLKIVSTSNPAQIVDATEYLLDYPSEAGRIQVSDLKEGSHGNRDFKHAFCDYTFYHTYNATTGALSNGIPTSGDYAGLPYYGGEEQYKRAFYGTYTVDENQFGKEYLISSINNSQDDKYFFGKAETAGDKGYGMRTLSNLADARNETTMAFRWLFTGDPYNMQILNEGMGTNYQSYPLASTSSVDGYQNYAQSTGYPMLLTDDGQYAVMKNFEIIQKENGSYVIYSIDTENRYTSSVTPWENNIMFIRDNYETALHITPAVEQFDITWQIIDHYGNKVDKAVYVSQNISKGLTLNISDMPQTLQRHFCKYEKMYSDEECTTELTELDVTENATIYVKYELESGAPVFYQTAASATENPEKYYIRFYQNIYVYEDENENKIAVNNDKESTETGSHGKWILIGSPYHLQLMQDNRYISIDQSKIRPNCDIPTITNNEDDQTLWELFDDAKGDRALVCFKDDNHLLFIGNSATLDIENDMDNAKGVEFIPESGGLDGLQMVLTFNEATLRPDTSPETIQINTFQPTGKSLLNVMPEEWKRPYCDYTFKYNNEDVTEITQDMVNDESVVTISVTYEVQAKDKCGFQWSSQGNGDHGDHDNLHWYYMVNRHRQGINDGYMLYQSGEETLRISSDYINSWLYTINYVWAAVGDPYGFKLLCQYDPDGCYDHYLAVQGESKISFNAEQNNIFEMRSGAYDGYFWMHPVYSQEFRSQTDDQIQAIGGNSLGTMPELTPVTTIRKLKTNSTANYHLVELNTIGMEDYVRYAGFVGALTDQAVTSDERLSAMRETLDNGEILTEEDKLYIKEATEEHGNMVEMKQGYYRIIPYVYEKKELADRRLYLRGYLYGNGTGNKRELDNNKGLVVSDEEEDAVYDPASIFHFNQQLVNGKIRYQISTQGLSLTGSSLREDTTPFNSQYANMGFGFSQIKTSENGTLEYNYLATASEWNEEDAYATLRNPFEMYNQTRMYLQPVASSEDSYNRLPLKLKFTQKEGAAYNFTSYYVPFDMWLPDGCVAFTGIGVHETLNDPDGWYYRVTCKSIDYFNGKDQDESDKYYDPTGRYVPAGTPVLLRTKAGTEEITIELPNDAVSEPISEEYNIFQGSYLNCILDNVTDGSIYVNSWSTNHNAWAFLKNANTDMGGEKNNRFVKSNRMYYVKPADNAVATRFLLVFDDDDTPTSVTNLRKENQAADNIYDLQGRKVSRPGKGIYIMNGKKIIFK